MEFENLWCEYQQNPLGIGVARPEFGWSFSAAERGAAQSAYRLTVSSSLKLLQAGQYLWDSGKIRSSQSAHIAYQGKELASRSTYYWRVQAWDEQEQEIGFSEARSFETALLSQSDWQASWIAPQGVDGRAPIFRREFELAQPVEAIAKARAYISGLGYYVFSLNGKRIGERQLDPVWTDYGKRVLYSTYDLTAALRDGLNCLGVTLGVGWYRLLRFIARIEITYADGSVQSIVSERNGWRYSYGPIVDNSLYFGEKWDLRKEQPFWDCPGFAAQEELWRLPLLVDSPGGALQAQQVEPIAKLRQLTAKLLHSLADGSFVFDLGQNIAGWVHIKVQGQAGDEIAVYFAENLEADGTLDQGTHRRCTSPDVLILKDSQPVEWEPSFTYHGFRYFQVSGLRGKPEPGCVLGIEVRTAVKERGGFECSDPFLNRLFECVRWTESDNLHGVMTDCPQRDERLGWLNDLTVRLEEAIYNFELPQLLRKVEQDIADAQGPGGAIKDVAPFSISHFGNDPADPVCSSFLLLPYLMYLHWADKKIIERHYEAVRGWTLYLHKNSSDGLVDFGYYGDWASPIIYCQEESPVSAITPPAYMSAGFQCLNLKLMGFFASLLGKTQDQQMFGELAQTAVAAFNAKYLDRQKGSYCTGSQACNSFALWLEIVPPEIVPRVAANLAQDVIAKDYHLSTGNICTKYLPEMLAEHGYGDVALKLICQRTYPSWGYMLEHGATTVWERWERETKGGMNSHNHPMNATIGSWFYKYLAGILPDPVRPGFERFFLKPYFLEGIDWVKCRLQTLYGLIEVRWERTAAGIALYAVVPSNSAAQVILPEGYVAEDDQALQLMSGRYRLEIKKLK